NAAALDALLTTVLKQWPVPVTGLSLIGHSMGGLVTRSALHMGQDRHRDWVSALRHVVYLGTPHRGSTVEVGANLAASALAAFAESAPLARPLRLRSAGIKDLRFGYLTKQDWLGHDQDTPFTSPPKPLRKPPPSHVREHFLAVTVSRNPRGVAANLFGDLVVTPNSAADSAGADTADRIRLGGLNHFNLRGHETVYDRLHDWLGELPRPEL
ncbi:MAG: esterase/lipase family protein, partial [Sciscionella sp.]